MTAVLDVLSFIIGAGLAGLVIYDVFQTVIVPRWTERRWRMGPSAVRRLWPWWRARGLRMSDADKREDFLGAFAPFSLMLILMLWLSSSVLAYGLMLHALRDQMKPHLESWSDAFYAAGVSLLTVGFGDFVGASGAARMVTLCAAASGLAVVALVISWTFSLYASFGRREVQVVTLDARAGAPPSGLMLLETYARLEMRDRLPALFDEWENWAAEVLESHIAYPILPFFRSSHDGESWVSAMGAVLDAATLLLTTVDDGPHGQARLMHGLGAHALLDLSHYFNVPRQGVGGGVGVERMEWNIACRKLEKVGYKLREPESAWQDFSEARATYAENLNGLARLLASPPTQWIGDRSVLPYERHRHTEDAEPQTVGERSTGSPHSTPAISKS